MFPDQKTWVKIGYEYVTVPIGECSVEGFLFHESSILVEFQRMFFSEVNQEGTTTQLGSATGKSAWKLTGIPSDSWTPGWGESYSFSSRVCVGEVILESLQDGSRKKTAVFLGVGELHGDWRSAAGAMLTTSCPPKEVPSIMQRKENS